MNSYLRLKPSFIIGYDGYFDSSYLSWVLTNDVFIHWYYFLLVLGACVLCNGVRVRGRSNDAHPQWCVLGASEYLLHGLCRTWSAVSARPQCSIQASIKTTPKLSLLFMCHHCPSRKFYCLNHNTKLQKVRVRDSKWELSFSPHGINQSWNWIT